MILLLAIFLTIIWMIMAKQIPRAGAPDKTGTFSGGQENISESLSDLKVDPSFYRQVVTNMENDPASSVTSIPTLAPTPKPKSPSQQQGQYLINAKSYLVGDIQTGRIYYSKDSKRVLPVASMSKLITAIAATDSKGIDKIVFVPESEIFLESDPVRFSSGDKLTVKELLYPLLLNSSNTAAEILALDSGRIDFLELMSSYSWEIGMPSSFFADPSGISPQNMSTAEDFFALAKYLYKFRPDLLEITRLPGISLATTTDHGSYVFRNIHPFATHPDFIGGKTGHTEAAGDTMLTIMTVKEKPFAIIVIGSASRKQDTQILLDHMRK